MSNCYWNQKLTDESSFLCTFNSPYERYRFRRTSFGILCVSEVAKKWSRNILVTLRVHYQCSMIGGKNEKEHDLVLRKVLIRARERNIKFNREKIQFRVPQVKNMGEVVSGLGFSPGPDPRRISAFHMPTPSCKQDFQMMLGMMN